MPSAGSSMSVDVAGGSVGAFSRGVGCSPASTKRCPRTGYSGAVSVAVIGGAGYIGAHVVRLLRASGEHVLVVDDFSTGSIERVARVDVLRADISQHSSVARVAEEFSRRGVSAVIHFAAKKQVGESVKRPAYYYRQNVAGLANAIDAMEIAGVRRLVFSSSAAVYGSPAASPIDELSPTEPINPYGETKLAGEWLVRDAGHAWGLESTCLRYFNVAGAGTPDLGDPAVMNLVTIVLDRLARQQRPQVYGNDYPTPDGTCIRDYVHVQDLAEAHLAALTHLRRSVGVTSEVFNVGTGRGHSVREVIEEIRRATGTDFETEVIDRRPGDPAAVVAAVAAIESATGWRARYGLPEIIQSAWDAWQVGLRPV